MISFSQFFVEKYILGLEETISLDGIGDILAKLDSGNGAFNVLHGTNISINGDTVTFQTVNGQPIRKPVSDTVTINLGAGNTEERPVVTFNVKIGDKTFPNIPFSIGNRTDNTHKVLIGKSFIQNELDALIDVSLNNVAGKNIEVAL